MSSEAIERWRIELGFPPATEGIDLIIPLLGNPTDPSIMPLLLQAIEHCGKWAAFLNDPTESLIKIIQLQKRCISAGVSPDEILQHQEVVSAIASTQKLFKSINVCGAGLELLHQNVTKGRSPLPVASTGVQEWAIDLWDIVSGDGQVPEPWLKLRSNREHNAVFIMFIQTARDAWINMPKHSSGAAENNDA